MLLMTVGSEAALCFTEQLRGTFLACELLTWLLLSSQDPAGSWFLTPGLWTKP